MNTNVTMIPVAQLHPHPDNPRKDLGDITELTASIKANGVLQNLTVVPQSLPSGRQGYFPAVGPKCRLP